MEYGIGQQHTVYIIQERVGHKADKEAFSRSKNKVLLRKIAKQQGLKSAIRHSRKYNDASQAKVF